MGYSNVALKDKIIQLYPEIEQNGVSVNLKFNEEFKIFDVNIKKMCMNSKPRPLET